MEESDAPKRTKHIHVGAPACFALEIAMQHVNLAFDSYGSYVVGSALERPDWRDVDIRMIMSDDAFAAEFPNASKGSWEFDSKWLLLTTAISDWLRKQTGLPVDFQFQPQSHANQVHKKPRNAIGLRMTKAMDREE